MKNDECLRRENSLHFPLSLTVSWWEDIEWKLAHDNGKDGGIRGRRGKGEEGGRVFFIF